VRTDPARWSFCRGRTGSPWANVAQTAVVAGVNHQRTMAEARGAQDGPFAFALFRAVRTATIFATYGWRWHLWVAQQRSWR
jgi:hypothetical protein